MTVAAFWDGVAWLRGPGWRYVRAAIAVALLLFVAHYRYFEIEYCAVCASERQTHEWGFGLGRGQGLTLGASDNVLESAAYRDLCDASHVHDWRTDHVADTHLLTGCLCCCGWRRGAFAGLYEREPELREIVRREIDAGSLDQITALRLVAVPWVGWCADRAAPGTLPDAALLATAERILSEHFAPRGAEAPGYVATYLRWMGANSPSR